MIIVDSELNKREAQGNPVRVAMIGAGFMGRGIALQMANFVKGTKLVAIANRLRRIERAPFFKQRRIDDGLVDCAPEHPTVMLGQHLGSTEKASASSAAIAPSPARLWEPLLTAAQRST